MGQREGRQPRYYSSFRFRTHCPAVQYIHRGFLRIEGWVNANCSSVAYKHRKLGPLSPIHIYIQDIQETRNCHTILFVGSQQRCGSPLLNCSRMVYRIMATSREDRPPTEIPFCLVLPRGMMGLNHASPACIATQFLCTRYLSYRNLKCLGSNVPIPFPPQPTDSSCCFQREGLSLRRMPLGKRNERFHSCLNWDPAFGLSLLHKHEESLHTQTCTGLMFAPSWRAGLAFSGRYPVGKRAGFSQLGTWLFPW